MDEKDMLIAEYRATLDEVVLQLHLARVQVKTLQQMLVEQAAAKDVSSSRRKTKIPT
jgi:hypothetical protein